MLGQELQKYITCDAPSHKELDICDISTVLKYRDSHDRYDLIIHAAAYTDVVKAEEESSECMEVNVNGTINLLDVFDEIPFVYISSEYAHKPVNVYSNTKLLSEKVVELMGQGYYGAPYYIIRTLFKPNPFPWEKAFVDQYTQGDYVDVIAPLIADKIMMWDLKSSNFDYVGTGRKTMFELAKRTRPDVKPISVDDITNVTLPKDYE